LPHLWVSKFDESRNETKIHDESGLFVKEFIAQNNSKSEYKYLDLSLIDAQFLKDSITNENYEGVLLIRKRPM
jgi:ABC-2 type transport system permease protein